MFEAQLFSGWWQEYLEPLHFHQLESAALSRWARMYRKFGRFWDLESLGPNSDCSQSTWTVTYEGSMSQDRKTKQLCVSWTFPLSTYDCCKLFGTSVKPPDTHWQFTWDSCFGVYMWSYVWIMFLDQKRSLLVTKENHVQFLWTFL